MALLNRISAWWMLSGVIVIVGVLIFGPTSHQDFSWVFGHRFNNTGFSGHIYWFFVLPLGFLLTMYTFTGYDASAHLSEETHDAERSAPEGYGNPLRTRRSAAGFCSSRSRSLPRMLKRSTLAAAAPFQ